MHQTSPLSQKIFIFVKRNFSLNRALMDTTDSLSVGNEKKKREKKKSEVDIYTQGGK